MSTHEGKRERRRSRRFRTRARCWITGEESALYTPIRNLSKGGLSVPGPVPFREGDEVSIRIVGPGHRADVVARSRVVWSHDEHGDPPGGLGAEFLEIVSGEHLLDTMLESSSEKE